MNLKEEILDFIERRWRGSEDLFTNGNCYWFAQILTQRFPSTLEIMYLPVEGHFVAYDSREDAMYDVNGELTYEGPKILLSEICETDFNWYERLLKDCWE